MSAQYGQSFGIGLYPVTEAAFVLLVCPAWLLQFWGGAAAVPAAGPGPVGPSVTLLLERLKNATLLSDRREIVQELKVWACVREF